MKTTDIATLIIGSLVLSEGNRVYRVDSIGGPELVRMYEQRDGQNFGRVRFITEENASRWSLVVPDVPVPPTTIKEINMAPKSPATVAPARAATKTAPKAATKTAAEPKPKREKAPPKPNAICLACGGETKSPRSRFHPGHDATLKGDLARIFRGEEKLTGLSKAVLAALREEGGVVGFRLDGDKLVHFGKFAVAALKVKKERKPKAEKVATPKAERPTGQPQKAETGKQGARNRAKVTEAA